MQLNVMFWDGISVDTDKVVTGKPVTDGGFPVCADRVTLVTGKPVVGEGAGSGLGAVMGGAVTMGSQQLADCVLNSANVYDVTLWSFTLIHTVPNGVTPVYT